MAYSQKLSMTQLTEVFFYFFLHMTFAKFYDGFLMSKVIWKKIFFFCFYFNKTRGSTVVKSIIYGEQLHKYTKRQKTKLQFISITLKR